MFIRTERLLLRPGWPEDARELAEAIGEERIVRNLARAPWPYDLGAAQSYLSTGIDGSLPAFLVALRTAGTPELAGAIGLDRTRDGGVELGYWMASRLWNRGLVTEAGRAVLALARDGLRIRRIASGHFLDNPESGRVLEKLGFVAGDVGLRHSRARGEEAAIRRYSIDLGTEVHDRWVATIAT